MKCTDPALAAREPKEGGTLPVTRAARAAPSAPRRAAPHGAAPRRAYLPPLPLLSSGTRSCSTRSLAVDMALHAGAYVTGSRRGRGLDAGDKDHLGRGDGGVYGCSSTGARRAGAGLLLAVAQGYSSRLAWFASGRPSWAPRCSGGVAVWCPPVVSVPYGDSGVCLGFSCLEHSPRLPEPALRRIGAALVGPISGCSPFPTQSPARGSSSRDQVAVQPRRPLGAGDLSLLALC